MSNIQTFHTNIQGMKILNSQHFSYKKCKQYNNIQHDDFGLNNIFIN